MDIVVSYAAGLSADQIAEAVRVSVAARANADPASLPVRVARAGTHLVFDWNPSFDFDGNGTSIASAGWVSPEANGDTSFFPQVGVGGTHPGLLMTVLGGARSPYERAVQHQQVELAKSYGSIIDGKGNIIFGSGFLPNTVDHDDTLRAFDFGRAISHCFSECDFDDVIVDDNLSAIVQNDQVGTGSAASGSISSPSDAGITNASDAGTPKFCVPTTLRAIEVNQVIQTLKNDIPLIKGKLTTARAFLDVPAGGRHPIKVNLQGFSYEDVVGDACDPSTSSDCTKVALDDGPDTQAFEVKDHAIENRRLLERSAQFDLPRAWLSRDILELKVSVVGGEKLICRERADETAVNDCTVRVHLKSYGKPVSAIGFPLELDVEARGGYVTDADGRTLT